MRKKQISIVLLVVIAFVRALPIMGNVRASHQIIIGIYPETTVVGIGESFTVDVNISDAVDIVALQFVLRYDPNILNATDVMLPVEGSFIIIDGELTGVPTVWEGYDCDIVPDGVLDIYDFVAWTNAVGTSDPRADINNDGWVDLQDYLIFREAWEATFVDMPGTIWFMDVPHDPWEGGTFATVTFEAIGLGGTLLDLDDTKLSSNLAEPIPHEIRDGNVCITPIPIPGDIDCDGAVDSDDLYFFARAYGTSVGDPAYNPAADLENDGDVDSDDLYVFAGNYGLSI